MRPHLRGAISRLMIFCLVGWTLAIAMACVLVPRIYRRYGHVIPFVREASWNRTMEQKKAQLGGVPWQDKRPLFVFAGDSHVEMGDWYSLWAGRFAVRNCGLSMAKIEDVEILAGTIADRPVDTVVLMCGVNNLGAKEAVDSCAAKYERLLSTVSDVLQPRRIVVASVMPVQQTYGEQTGSDTNRRIAEFNEKLAAMSTQYRAIFVPVDAVVSNSEGGLKENLTFDGLHLNSLGYAMVAPVLQDVLEKTASQP